jgi:hypothetical protein
MRWYRFVGEDDWTTGQPTFLETLLSLLGRASSAEARHRQTVELTDLLQGLRFRLDTPKNQQVASQRSGLAEMRTRVGSPFPCMMCNEWSSIGPSSFLAYLGVRHCGLSSAGLLVAPDGCFGSRLMRISDERNCNAHKKGKNMYETTVNADQGKTWKAVILPLNHCILVVRGLICKYINRIHNLLLRALPFEPTLAPLTRNASLHIPSCKPRSLRQGQDPLESAHVAGGH